MKEYSDSFDEIICEISQNYHKIKNSKLITTLELEYFKREFSISNTHNSNAIEGNTFTFDETKLLLERGIISGTHSIRESLDIIGYKEAFDFLYESFKNKKSITEEFIKQIHYFVLKDEIERGTYRTIQNYIGDIFRTIYTPPAPFKVPELMSEYVKNLNEEILTILNKKNDEENNMDFNKLFHLVAKHHILFENIHPFIDGNGRTGRLLLIYEMMLFGLLPLDIKLEDRDLYYSTIKNFRKKEKYSDNELSKTLLMAKLLAKSELESMKVWLAIYGK